MADSFLELNSITFRQDVTIEGTLGVVPDEPWEVGAGDGDEATTSDSEAVLWNGARCPDPAYGFQAAVDAGDQIELVAGRLQMAGVSTNLALLLLPKGTGALQSDSAGNARGARSVDLQRSRTTTARVVSGADSLGVGADNAVHGTYCRADGQANTIGVATFEAVTTHCQASGQGNTIAVAATHAEARGQNNTIGTAAVGSRAGGVSCAVSTSAIQAVAEGRECTAGGNYSRASGYQCTATGVSADAEGYQCTATGNYSKAVGRGAVARNIGGVAYSSELFNSTQGLRQFEDVPLQQRTTNTTPISLMTETGTTQRPILANSSTYAAVLEALAHNETTGERAFFRRRAVLSVNSSGVVTIHDQATLDSYHPSDWLSAVPTFSGGASPNRLYILVTGNTSENISWQGAVRLYQIGGL